MNNWQSRKASIRRHQLPFLQQIADEMGYYSISDAVDYAIDACKKYRALEPTVTVTKTELNSQIQASNLQPQVDLNDAFDNLDLED